MNAREQFEAAGYVFEDFLNCWILSARGYQVTIADGISINGIAYEAQVATQEGRDIDASPRDMTPQEAIAFADLTMKRADAIAAADGREPVVTYAPGTLGAHFKDAPADVALVAFWLDAELLNADCPPDSHCGELIVAIVHAAAALVALITEQHERERILDAVGQECNVIYFG